MKLLKNKKQFVPTVLIFIWCAMLPLIVKIYIFENPLKDYAWYPPKEKIADFFFYWKMVGIIVTAVVMCIFLGYRYFAQKRRRFSVMDGWQIFFPLAGYAVLCILSAIFSEYRGFCVNGMPDMYESLWALLGYVAACVFSCWYIREYGNVEAAAVCLLGGGLLTGLICVLQFFHLDIYRLIYSSDGYVFSFAPGQVYGPFYNINYVGSYVVLLLPLFLLLAVKMKNTRIRILSAVAAIFLSIAVYGAESSAGIIALAASIVFAAWYLIFRFIRLKKGRMLFGAGTVLAAGIVFAVAAPYLNNYLLGTDTQKTDLEHVYTWQDNVEIDYRGHTLFIDMIDDGSGSLAFDLIDENGDAVQTEYVTAQQTEYEYYYYKVNDARFPDFSLVPSLFSEEPIQYVFQLNCDNSAWIFSKDVGDDGSYYWMNGNQVWVKLTEENDSADGILFGDMSSLANGRGFIWNKTLPLLADTVILGSGPDTYALVFPNDDYVDLYNNGYQNMFHVKPHNMYLQTAVQTGILSLICWLVFYLWYFVDSLRIYYRARFDNIEAICGFAVMIGTFGYMIAGLANDSTVAVAPVYWALMGIGIGINYRMKDMNQ